MISRGRRVRMGALWMMPVWLTIDWYERWVSIDCWLSIVDRGLVAVVDEFTDDSILNGYIFSVFKTALWKSIGSTQFTRNSTGKM